MIGKPGVECALRFTQLGVRRLTQQRREIHKQNCGSTSWRRQLKSGWRESSPCLPAAVSSTRKNAARTDPAPGRTPPHSARSGLARKSVGATSSRHFCFVAVASSPALLWRRSLSQDALHVALTKCPSPPQVDTYPNRPLRLALMPLIYMDVESATTGRFRFCMMDGCYFVRMCSALDRAAAGGLDVHDPLGRQDHSVTSELLPTGNNDFVETLTAARSYSQRAVNF